MRYFAYICGIPLAYRNFAPFSMQGKLGPLFTAVAGSIAGTTLQRMPYGTLVRTKPLPIRRRNENTGKPRSRWQELARLWQDLTPTQRSDWNFLAATITWTNRFGDTIPGRGQWLYMRCNMYLDTWEQAYIADAPTIAAVSDLVPDSITIALGSGQFELAWSSGDTAPNTPCLVYVSQPTRSSVGTPRRGYRYVGYVPENTGSPCNLFTMVEDAGLIGSLASGNYMVKLVSMDSNTGVIGSPQADVYPFTT